MYIINKYLYLALEQRNIFLIIIISGLNKKITIIVTNLDFL